jgi:hypothetical protein
MVLDFMRGIQPVGGACFCNDDTYGLNLTCGFHAILIFARDHVRLLVPSRTRARVAPEIGIKLIES